MLSYIAFCIYLAMEILRPEAFFPDSTTRVLLWAAVGLLICCLVDTLAGRRWRLYKSGWFVLGLIAVGLMSSTVAAIRGGSDEFVKWQELLNGLFLYLIGLQTIDRPSRLATVRNLLVVFILVLAAMAVLFGLGVAAPGYTWDEEQRLRYVGTLADANDLGMVFAVAFGILFYSLVNGVGKLRKFGIVLCLGVLLWAIFLSASRGTNLAVGAASIVALRGKIGFVKPAIAAGLILICMMQFGVARMDKLSSDEDSAEGRLDAWGAGWYMMRSNPILGVGPRNFMQDHKRTCHSTLVEAGSEMGLLGLFCWLGIFYYPIREFMQWSWLKERAPDSPSYEVQQLQVALIGCLVASLFLSRLYNDLPYLLAGMISAAREFHPNEDPDAEDSPRFRVDFKKLLLLQALALMFWRVAARDHISGI